MNICDNKHPLKQIHRYAFLDGIVVSCFALTCHVLPDGLCASASFILSFVIALIVFTPRKWLHAINDTFKLSVFRRAGWQRNSIGRYYCLFAFWYLSGFVVLLGRLVFFLTISINQSNPLGAFVVPLISVYGLISYLFVLFFIGMNVTGRLIVGHQKVPFVRKFAVILVIFPLLFPFGQILGIATFQWLKRSRRGRRVCV